MMPLGTKAPDFNLWDTISQDFKTREDLKGNKATVIMFICNHCPFVLHVNNTLVKLANNYLERDVKFIAISSNDVENYPQDSPELMALQAQKLNYPFPYLYDETQDIAKAYQAACTPDFYIFDADLKLAYRGQLDASRPGNDIPVTGRDLSLALDFILQNKPIDFTQKPSMGCNIKWK
jgi:thiol-disulfide isomerase/thioredoxin